MASLRPNFRLLPVRHNTLLESEKTRQNLVSSGWIPKDRL
jgi:hypothetical protein